MFGYFTYFSIATILFLALWSLRPKKHWLPPGPQPEPILGHARIVPLEKQGETFNEWAKVYGDVIYLKVFNREMIVLNSIEAAHDLLDKRSANYSSRPYFPVLEMMGWGGTIVLMRYGKQYTKLRKTFQQYFYQRETLVRDFIPVQTREARLLAKSLLTGTAPADAVGRFGIANSMSMTYGRSLFSAESDTYVHLGHEIEDAVNNGGPVGGTPVDFFPTLARFPSWFPGTYYGRRALTKHPIVRRIFDYPWEQFVAKRKTEKYNEPCFVTHLLQKAMERNPSNDRGLSTEEIEEIKGQATAAYTGGFDTVYATIMIFILSMVLYPEEQQKAQKEIDTVVGNTRLPQFEDRPSLPYVESVLQEVLRWGPAVPLGLPHQCQGDDIYRGMLIPAGAVIIPNIRGMGLNENVYRDPEQFNPSRFLPEPQGRGEPRFSAVWGFGRRICPGRYAAENSLWLVIATLLATVNILKTKDEHGNEITPEVKFTQGLANQPVPFSCEIAPRSEASVNLLDQDC